ncbi:MAG TPA: thiol:disulfide interchange protein DsbA/DsbL [Gammaproteobacteria bacterium]|jgi:thiol:disulfide interchange protein DsbA|nr:thiol:disulfide interchange protein DsbA/DsbL [Gammaproteobacteria bacterium]
MRSNALLALALTAAAWMAAPANAQNASQFQAGKHYTVLSPAVPANSPPGQVEVTEIFMFGCPGCYAFEPLLQKWVASKPSYVTFTRVPAMWEPWAPLHARAYYTAEALGRLKDIEGPFFNEFHAKGNRLDTEAKIAAFFQLYGVDQATFTSTFNSFSVVAKVKRAEDLVKRYRAQSTPTVVVNGKYLTTGAQAGSYDAWFAIIDELAAREHNGTAAAAN